MASMEDLIGSNLVNAKGDKIATSSISGEGRVVGLYFSAHWCPPCRAFTPVLAEFYSKFKAKSNGEKLEVVFISSDRDDSGFNEYLGTMPWLAVPYEDRDTKGKLSKKFKVQGIPTLVFIDGSTLEVITDKGRDRVTNDPNGEEFPWKPKPLADIMAGSLLKGSEELDCQMALDGKVKALYFTAHWCPPCRAFTPELITAYNKIKETKNLEVVFVSWDRSQESFDQYYSTMPWLAIPYGDQRANLLKSHFNIEGIPTLVVVDENNDLITTNGRVMVANDPEGKEFPWHPKPVEPLLSYTASKVNDDVALILFGSAQEGGTGRSWEEEARSYMEEPARQYLKEARANTALPSLNFFYEVDEEEDLGESLRVFAQLEDREPLLALIDIPDQRVYVCPDTTITTDVVQTVIDKFKTGKLEFRGLRG